jgi:hypothetical protein
LRKTSSRSWEHFENIVSPKVLSLRPYERFHAAETQALIETGPTFLDVVRTCLLGRDGDMLGAWTCCERDHSNDTRTKRKVISKMAKVFIMSTHGSEDPTRATLALVLAKAAVEEGHEVDIALAGDAGVNIRETVIENIHGMGFPPYKELMGSLISKQVNIHV